MWNKPWTLTEGFLIGGGLLVTALLLQLTVGSINWQIFAYPVNIIAFLLFLCIITSIHLLRNNVYAFRFLSTYQAAIPALVYTVGITIVMGITCDTSMLSHWYFVFSYLYLSVVLGLVILKRMMHFNIRHDIPFMLNHFGLFIVIVAATLGNADMRRLKMSITKDMPEWRAIDDKQMICELPIAIQLKQFTIEEYPPKLMLIDNKTNQPIPLKHPETLLIDSIFTQGKLKGHTIRLIKYIEMAAPSMSIDSTTYLPYTAKGAVCALLVSVDGHKGWVTSGSYLFPSQTLKIDNKVTLVMVEREPKRYLSRVEIMTKSGKDIETNIEVNKPFEVDGWKIYQLSYDEKMGKWSDYSIVELVSDPWLPVVYTGIFMMLAGALSMFILAQQKR